MSLWSTEYIQSKQQPASVEIETETSDTSASPNDYFLKSLRKGYLLVFTEVCFPSRLWDCPREGRAQGSRTRQIKAVSREPTAAEAACLRTSSQYSSVDGLTEEPWRLMVSGRRRGSFLYG